MSPQLTLADPEPGDVFAVIKHTAAPKSFWEVLCDACNSLMGRNPSYGERWSIQYRRVVSVSPTTVFFQDTLQQELFAAWKTEWYDFQSDAYQLVDKGVSLSAADLERITGLDHIPFIKPTN